MKYLSILLVVTLFFTSCSSGKNTDDTAYELANVEVIKTNDIKSMVQNKKYSAIYFWTTWCGPCRTTLKNKIKPILDSLNRDDVQILVVAISKKPEKVQEIIDNSGIETTTYVCNDYGFDNPLADKAKLNEIIETINDDWDFLNRVPIAIVTDKSGKIYGDTYHIPDIKNLLNGQYD